MDEREEQGEEKTKRLSVREKRVEAERFFFFERITKEREGKKSVALAPFTVASFLFFLSLDAVMSAFAAQLRARVATTPSASSSRCSTAAVVPRAAAAAAVSAAATSRLAAASISTPSTSSSSLPAFALHSRRRRGPSAPQAAPGADGVEPPTSAETARTIVDITAHGTLCTSGSDGVPLGEFFLSFCLFFLSEI